MQRKISEEYGRAALALMTAARQEHYHSIIFCSLTGGEGTSSTVLHVGRLLKQRLGLRPLLIELNRLRPAWGSQFGLDPAKSLAAVASGHVLARQCIQQDPSGLSMIPIGDYTWGDGQ